MFLYSETISTFLKRVRQYAREIFEGELSLEFKRTRFKYGPYSVPFHLVVFEKPGTLGFFDPDTYQLGLHKQLMYTAKEKIIKDILRHEIMHLLTFLRHGSDDSSHGATFHETCDFYNVSPEVRSATIDVGQANDQCEGDLDSERVIAKVKKLLSLSSSTNTYEAQLALDKANALLIRHNLDHLADFEGEDEEACCLRLIEGKRVTAKYRAMADILRSFFVHPVFNYGKGKFYLEVCGTRTHCLLAEYVAHFLEIKMEELWSQAKREHRGETRRNSKGPFMQGLAQGYLEKNQKLQSSLTKTGELMVIQQNLRLITKRVYGRLSSTSFGRQHDPHFNSLGKAAGKNLSIHPGIENRKKSHNAISYYLPVTD